MDKSIIEEVAFISKYFDKMDNNSFYKLCCEIVPCSRNFYPYIKNKNIKYTKELLEIVSKKFEVGENDAREYCDIFHKNPHTIHELKEIVRGFGYNDKEIKKIMEVD